MIISMNENNMDKYKALFAKAYQALDAIGKIREGCQNDEKRFLSLDDYFAHMGDLLELDLTYMMLPLDEQPFNINANTRAITAPKITVLQNDQVAETIMFTIDRYFDYMDLNNATVYVQWTLPDGRTEGATEIEMKDIEFEPGKIRFGWPLDSEITSQAGTVKYSVRFWIRSTVKDEQNQDVEKVVYSFNTLSSSFTVSPSLQVDINTNDEVNAPHRENIFVNAIRNSMVTNGSVAMPQDPSFSAPGLDLPANAYLQNNTLTLKALAVTGDNGILDYEWYYTPAVDITVDGTTYKANATYAFEDSVTKVVEEGQVKDVTVAGFKHMGGSVEFSYEEFDYAPETVVLNVKDQYFIKDESTTPVTYKAYEGGLNKPSDPAVKLYRKFITYTVPTGTITVTGKYVVCATNTTRVGVNCTSEIPSRTCFLVSPSAVEITKNLASRGWIEDAQSSIGIITNANTQSDDATKTVVWERSVTGADKENAQWKVIPDCTDASLNIYSAAPGWYRATPTVELNRETKSAVSNVCKVTALPKTPTLSYPENTPMKDGIASFDDNEANLEVVVDISSLKANISNLPADSSTYDASLFSEALSYTWFYQPINEQPKPVTQAEVASGLITGPINTNKLHVNAPSKLATTFTCKVVNTIGDKVSAAAELSFFVN